jgi:hypothetical protein
MRSTAHASRCAIALLFCAAASVILPSMAAATIINVPDDQTTIAAGIAATSPGDTVEVACNTYYEHGLVISSAITLKSETDQWGCVTIDGEATDTILRLSNASGAVISGITFTNGAALFGAGADVDSCDVAFRDCKFLNNTAEVEGGGLRYRYGNPDISYCEFAGSDGGDRGGNLALSGTGGSVMNCDILGGIAEWGGGACVRNEATTSFTFCTFSGNYAPDDEAYGGGFYCANQAAPTLQWCTFYQNSSDFCGGGAASDGNCTPVFSNCTFTENTSQWGGGLFVRESAGGTLTNSYFEDNMAQGGGGVFFEGVDDMQVNQCWFEDNVASEAGGGLLLESCGTSAGACTFTGNTAAYGGGMAAHLGTSPVTAVSCTFVLNQTSGARGFGGGIAISGGSPTRIEACIIAFSASGEAVYCEQGAAVTAELCVVFGNAGGDWVDCLSGQETLLYNSDGDPNFCGVFDWNYYLCEDSYCSPANNTPGVLIGSHDVQCDACNSPVEMSSWGNIKALYR